MRAPVSATETQSTARQDDPCVEGRQGLKSFPGDSSAAHGLHLTDTRAQRRPAADAAGPQGLTRTTTGVASRWTAQGHRAVGHGLRSAKDDNSCPPTEPSSSAMRGVRFRSGMANCMGSRKRISLPGAELAGARSGIGPHMPSCSRADMLTRPHVYMPTRVSRWLCAAVDFT